MPTRTPLAALAALALILVPLACGDDGGEGGDRAGGDDPAATTAAPEAPATTLAGPTEGGAACARLADRYVRRARVLFTQEGTPPDDLVDSTRARLAGLDEIAAAAGCGAEYVTGVCEGLDALSQEGILVLYPLTTAQCL